MRFQGCRLTTFTSALGAPTRPQSANGASQCVRDYESVSVCAVPSASVPKRLPSPTSLDVLCATCTWQAAPHSLCRRQLRGPGRTVAAEGSRCHAHPVSRCAAPPPPPHPSAPPLHPSDRPSHRRDRCGCHAACCSYWFAPSHRRLLEYATHPSVAHVVPMQGWAGVMRDLGSGAAGKGSSTTSVPPPRPPTAASATAAAASASAGAGAGSANVTATGEARFRLGVDIGGVIVAKCVRA